jgi:DNA invertase Pin-like site-specific DNA recombinase
MHHEEKFDPEEEAALANLLAKKARISKVTIHPQSSQPVYVPVKTGYIYCRVSTDKQNESLHAQESQLRALASREKIEVLGVFHEEDVSARSNVNNRPQLRALIDKLIPGQYVMVVHLDRLSRDKRSQDAVTFLIEDARCFIITPTRNPNDPNVEANDTIQYFASAMEAKRISERISNAMSILSVEGNLRTTPWFGWEFDSKTTDWVKVPREQALIERAVDLYVNHKKSPNAIAKIFNEVDKAYAREYVNKKGEVRHSKFYNNTITNILIHAGVMKVKGIEDAKKPYLRVNRVADNHGTVTIPN